MNTEEPILEIELEAEIQTYNFEKDEHLKELIEKAKKMSVRLGCSKCKIKFKTVLMTPINMEEYIKMRKNDQR